MVRGPENVKKQLKQQLIPDNNLSIFCEYPNSGFIYHSDTEKTLFSYTPCVPDPVKKKTFGFVSEIILW
jgi:hypothetical protein